jgi:hypothetical protein
MPDERGSPEEDWQALGRLEALRNIGRPKEVWQA